jgi:hypothetical protein
MHEIGHTMGLTHANENGEPYADSSGYMAAGYKDTDWPRKCFNGHKVRMEQCAVLFVLWWCIRTNNLASISIEGLLIRCLVPTAIAKILLSFCRFTNHETHRRPFLSSLRTRSRTGFLDGTKIAT